MNQQKFDIAVIGGGASGMMAAGRAAELGAKVVLIEKNIFLGKKLLMTGGGRCNITNISLHTENLAEKLGRNGKFLFSSLYSFGPQEVIDFLAELKVKTRVEENGKVFASSGRASDVIDALTIYLRRNGVEIITGKEVLGFDLKDSLIESVRLEDRNILASNFILSTGGKSYPATGSTGAGYFWAKDMGHTVIPPAPALSPIRIKGDVTQSLQGLSFNDVSVRIMQDGNKKLEKRGEMIFTHFGLSGPMILNMSKAIGEILREGKTSVEIDTHPDETHDELDKMIQDGFRDNSNKDLKNHIADFMPDKLAAVVPGLLQIDPDKKINLVTKEERRRITNLLKGFRLNIEGVMGFDSAMVTGGGVSLKEVDPRTMRSKIVPNLFLTGEILDLDGPTGGYNLQIAWSTGRAAGESAARSSS
ncbi:MAG: NAD(P)/FAD-dependent oxidoreductase [Candidatus Moranbacteria bacterium]|nr:NAD(P)/FAD-dependent oxidoreductase [Candidatus Moranbacteria bacterium]